MSRSDCRFISSLRIQNDVDYRFISERRIQHAVIDCAIRPFDAEILLNEISAFFVDRVHEMQSVILVLASIELLQERTTYGAELSDRGLAKQGYHLSIQIPSDSACLRISVRRQ